jgi:ABC-type sugar transport system substrate-binding protein
VERAEKKMKKKIAFLTLSAVLLAFCFPAAAQQAKKVHRIGYLSTSNFSARPATLGAFRQTLRDLD